MNGPVDKQIREARTAEQIKHLAMEFLERESNRTSLITVTDVRFYDKGKKAEILVTVLPDHSINAVLDFLHRQRNEFRGYVKARSRLRVLPYFSFELDVGEKNRQKIDSLI